MTRKAKHLFGCFSEPLAAAALLMCIHPPMICGVLPTCSCWLRFCLSLPLPNISACAAWSDAPIYLLVKNNGSLDSILGNMGIVAKTCKETNHANTSRGILLETNKYALHTVSSWYRSVYYRLTCAINVNRLATVR